MVRPTVRNLLPLTAVNGDTKRGLLQSTPAFFCLRETESRDDLPSYRGGLTVRIGRLTIFGDGPFGVVPS